jgi:hypothetical protein
MNQTKKQFTGLRYYHNNAYDMITCVRDDEIVGAIQVDSAAMTAFRLADGPEVIEWINNQNGTDWAPEEDIDELLAESTERGMDIIRPTLFVDRVAFWEA